jgi:phosphoenolpyruvate carboxykinase (ATP)
LSADPKRRLIGDDEHGWTDQGIFNIEGGCYAKAVGLREEAEPEIFGAIRFGSVLENVVYDPTSRVVDYDDVSVTQNTRCSYPIEYIPSAKIPCVGTHPKNVLFLTFDAFGVLPPVSRLTREQAMYHFISGYTAKVAGTEMGVSEPKATFSPCFGGPFMVWRPTHYARLLAEKLERHGSQAWLVNTGYFGGVYGVGQRIALEHTRAIVDAIHSGQLSAAPTTEEPVFGLQVPVGCPGVPDDVLIPQKAWKDQAAYQANLGKLARLFAHNFNQYEGPAFADVQHGGPRL